MMKFIRTTFISAISLYLIDYVLGGLGFPDLRSVLATALLLGIINATIKPILKLLAMPLNFLTLGLFTFVINGALLMFAVNYSGGHMTSLVSAIIASLALSVVNSVLSVIFKD